MILIILEKIIFDNGSKERILDKLVRIKTRKQSLEFIIVCSNATRNFKKMLHINIIFIYQILLVL